MKILILSVVVFTLQAFASDFEFGKGYENFPAKKLYEFMSNLEGSTFEVIDRDELWLRDHYPKKPYRRYVFQVQFENMKCRKTVYERFNNFKQQAPEENYVCGLFLRELSVQSQSRTSSEF